MLVVAVLLTVTQVAQADVIGLSGVVADFAKDVVTLTVLQVNQGWSPPKECMPEATAEERKPDADAEPLKRRECELFKRFMDNHAILRGQPGVPKVLEVPKK